LKRISGIAAVLEKKLNEFGIYTYRQIMDWDEAAVEEFSTLLAFRDRIQRDDWMGQARHLYEEKYSKAA
jgi:predicted flap endonuclease-1-like 5' DNA nuclease